MSVILIIFFAFLAVNNARVGEIFYPGQYIDDEKEIHSAVCQVKQNYMYQDGYNYAIALCYLDEYTLYMEQFYSLYPLEWTCPVFIVLPDMLSKVLD